MRTIPNHDINRPVVGYMLNTEISPENCPQISHIQAHLSEHFGDAVWNTPPETLHITLFDWLAPLVDYGQDKERLFEQIFPEYDKAVRKAVAQEHLVRVTFDTINVSPAAVFITGHDDGTFARIRKFFLDHAVLLPNTKLPPQIIHSTIARFVGELSVEEVQASLKGLHLSFEQPVASFRLIKETLDPMLQFEEIKRYQLKGV